MANMKTPALLGAVQTVAVCCGKCGFGQKSDGSGEWDGTTTITLREGEKPKCRKPEGATIDGPCGLTGE